MLRHVCVVTNLLNRELRVGFEPARVGNQYCCKDATGYIPLPTGTLETVRLMLLAPS